ncbi:hypothetical protein BIW11_02643 [Tropilaelaps mercedesae]|uniref:Uncharacterized protein n=1 Tax=Tropilaelaps mercedesae TaxID=418985 RepID=A0A1V9XZM0_9ACAR|nr:hypothetical protein BIW11_02643 [Tropilaelaps mercedesae]
MAPPPPRPQLPLDDVMDGAEHLSIPRFHLSDLTPWEQICVLQRAETVDPLAAARAAFPLASDLAEDAVSQSSTAMIRLALPSIVKFRSNVWNSRPLEEAYLATISARSLYNLNEAEYRLTLINAFSILHSYAKQLKIELQYFTRNVEHFDIVAPALAWGIIRYLILKRSAYSSEVKTCDDHVPLAAVCAILFSDGIQRPNETRTLASTGHQCQNILEDFRLYPGYTTTVVKYVVLFFRTHTTARDDAASLMFRCQLARFGRVFIVEGLGPWMLIDDVTTSRPKHVQCLIDALDACSAELAESSPELLNNNRYENSVHRRIVHVVLRHLDGHVLLSKSKLPQHQALIRYLQAVKDELDRLRQKEKPADNVAGSYVTIEHPAGSLALPVAKPALHRSFSLDKPNRIALLVTLPTTRASDLGGGLRPPVCLLYFHTPLESVVRLSIAHLSATK